MLKKIITRSAMVLVASLFAVSAFAAGSFAGKVTKVEGDNVTIKAEKDIPAWVKKGGKVSAVGGTPTVLQVKGDEATLKFGKAKASKIKLDSKLTVSEPKAAAREQMQGC